MMAVRLACSFKYIKAFSLKMFITFQIASGSADRHVYIWDTTSRRILYKLPGHNGSVNDVDFSSKEPIIVSASSDKTLYLGEIED